MITWPGVQHVVDQLAVVHGGIAIGVLRVFHGTDARTGLTRFFDLPQTQAQESHVLLQCIGVALVVVHLVEPRT